jgi:OmpA-OmpF porin, OOP family
MKGQERRGTQSAAEREIPAANLTAHGYGPDQPVADNRTEQGRAANRRVELRLMK